MPTPRIRFFTGAQGQRIAYAISGSGPPLVLPAWWVSHVERDWDNERFRAFFEALARHHTVIRYDRPGVGLSVRERSEFTLENEVDTLGSLIEHLGFERVSFLGFSCGGPPAVTYATRNPDRVDRLVLVGSYAYGGDLATAKLVGALVDLVEEHWGLGAQTIADLFAPDLEKKQARQLARSQHDWASAELAARLLELSFSMDCREVALRLSRPTLVIHRRNDQTVHLAAGRDLAARVSNAELITLEGNAHVPWEGESEPIVEAVLEFLGGPDGHRCVIDRPRAPDSARRRSRMGPGGRPVACDLRRAVRASPSPQGARGSGHAALEPHARDSGRRPDGGPRRAGIGAGARRLR